MTRPNRSATVRLARRPGATARATLAAAAALLLAACGPERGPDAGSVGEPPTPEAIASALQPALQIAGEPRERYDIEARMAHYNVPAVSVAVLHDGRIAWARGWGIADTETGAPVTPGTLFQAASISKPVAALAAMSLVEDGAVVLDGPVNDHLTSWKVPDSQFTADSAVTLRGILSHTAGLTVWGFPGYRKDRPFADDREIATNVEVLDGLGNTDPVRVFREPGIAWLYSGGGYTVMEEMIENVTARPFAEVMGERVLDPAGMERSTFEQPLPPGHWNEAARAHRGDGSKVPGEWHSYPEQAAAGLWTTPSDLLALSAHLLAILEGTETDGVVTHATLETMLISHRGDEEGFEPYGLGFGVEGEGDAVSFGHGGSNAGFRARWITFPRLRQGAVVMTNADSGAPLAQEILRGIAEALNWPRFQSETRERRLLDEQTLASYEGSYELESSEEEFVITVRPGEGVLLIDVPGQGTLTLHGEVDQPDHFFDASDGQSVAFERADEGSITTLVLPGDARLMRR